jgi:hypothetical protein
MGSNDIPPAGCPWWLIPASTVCLGMGGMMWNVTYVLMTIRSIQTKSYGMPLLALSLNVSWELVYSIFVAEPVIERVGFAVWLVLDIGLVYNTVKYGRNEWEHSPFVARHIASILLIMTAVGLVGNYAFASWWLKTPGLGHGSKVGKFHSGVEEIDCTELTFWSAAAMQLPASSGSLAMLLVRGHSGGTSYAIWSVNHAFLFSSCFRRPPFSFLLCLVSHLQRLSHSSYIYVKKTLCAVYRTLPEEETAPDPRVRTRPRVTNNISAAECPCSRPYRLDVPCGPGCPHCPSVQHSDALLARSLTVALKVLENNGLNCWSHGHKRTIVVLLAGSAWIRPQSAGSVPLRYLLGLRSRLSFCPLQYSENRKKAA